MRKVLGRIIAIVAVIALSFTVAQGYVAKAADEETITVYVTIEKTSIGQGFLIEPTRLVVPKGTTAKEAIEEALEEEGGDYSLKITETQFGGYISGIKDADDGEVDIPDSIANLPSYTNWDQTVVAPPSNDNNDGNVDDDLDEKDYNSTSGWMGFINNASAEGGLDAIELSDNDVVRLQFSIFGYGLDLGYSYNPSVEKLTVANKDALIKAAADMWYLIPDSDWDDDIDNEYEGVIDALENHDLTQDDADNLLGSLKYYPVKQDETTTQEVTTTAAETTTVAETTTAVETTTAAATTEAATTTATSAVKKVKKPARVKIKKVAKKKKAAKKLKVKFKKVKNADGYQVAVLKSKSVKKALVKKYTKKTTYTIKSKKIKNKKKLFVAVRAYAKDGKTKVFGKWSKVKKVKVK